MIIKKNQIKNSRKLLALYVTQLGPLTQQELEIGIGLMLGDASIQTQNKGKTYRLKIEQSDKHKDYCFHLANVFDRWVLQEPKEIIRNGVSTWRFQTISSSAFTKLAYLFLNEKQKKQVFIKELYPYFTPLSLAYWFMDDGGKLDYNKNGSKGIVFNTQGFSFAEVQDLKVYLIETYNLNCWIKKNKNKPVLAISGKDYEKVMSLIESYIIPSMLHKLPRARKS